MQRRVATFGVFLAALLVLGWRASIPGIATGYVDPVAKIQAQDEAVYGSTAFTMASEGGWLTPTLLGRYALYKPPLLYWLNGISGLALGRSSLALRLSSIVAGAATLALVFLWAGLPAAILLLSCHLFFTLSRLGLTDALLTFEIVAAMFILSRHAGLRTRTALWSFGFACGAAIMTKGIAGILPLLVLVFIAPSRLPPAIGVAALFAAPWHIYQLVEHPHWFWAEYFRSEIFSWGLASPEQTTNEGHLAFYSKRLLLLDPILLAAAVWGLVKSSVSPRPEGRGWKKIRPLRERPPHPAPPVRAGLLVWLLVVLGSAMAFQYRNAAYLLPAYPAMAILAGAAIPKQARIWAVAAVAAVFAIKAAAPKEPWGLPFAPENVNPSYAALDGYAALHRGNDLIMIAPTDQFYSACLGLAHVRYLYLDSRASRPKLPLDFEYLGLVLNAPDFNRLPEMRPVFEQRLREFDLASGDPIGTTILARSDDEIAGVIRQHPEADFFRSGEFTLASKVIQRP
jgi:4-amino-4-deoxy-L-arabinose transferase-like glycosyltransferase